MLAGPRPGASSPKIGKKWKSGVQRQFTPATQVPKQRAESGPLLLSLSLPGLVFSVLCLPQWGSSSHHCCYCCG